MYLLKMWKMKLNKFRWTSVVEMTIVFVIFYPINKSNFSSDFLCNYSVDMIDEGKIIDKQSGNQKVLQLF